MPSRIVRLTNKTITGLKPEANRYEVSDAEMPGFKLRISPSGVKTFSLCYRNSEGDRTRYTIGKYGQLTLKQAREIAGKTIAEVKLGRDPQTEKKESRISRQKPTLGVFIEEQYLPWFEANYKAHVTRYTLRQFTELYDKKLDSVVAWDVERWRKRKLSEGLKRSTINRRVAELRSCFSRAVEWELVGEHPLRAVKQYREDKLAVVRFLDEDEERRLRAALHVRETKLRVKRESANQWRKERRQELLPTLNGTFVDHLKPMVLLSLNTGLRRGELFDLAWRNIDFKTRVLTVVGTSAKSGRTRHIPLNDESHETLRGWKAQADATDGLVFPSESGEPFDNVNKSWAGVLREAKITNFRWHDMRHHFASRLAMAGVDLNTIRELLGHSELTMTLRYAHLAPEHKAEAVARLMHPPTRMNSTTRGDEQEREP